MKRIGRGWLRFEESLETSVAPWVVMTGVALFALVVMFAYYSITGWPTLD